MTMEELITRRDSTFLFIIFMCNLEIVDAYSTILSSLWYFWFAIIFGISFFVFVACLLGRAANRKKTRVATMGPYSGAVPPHVHNQPTSYPQPPPPYTTSQPPPPYTATASYPPPGANDPTYPPPGTSSLYPPPGTSDPAYPPPGTSSPAYPPPGTSDPAYPPGAFSSNVPPPDPFATAVREANPK